MSIPQQSTIGSARPLRPRRSVLYVPASNARALEKAADLPCDTVIFDLEDGVGPAEKTAAREALARWFAKANERAREYVVRINALSSEWGQEDADAALRWEPDALLLPKVSGTGDVFGAETLLAGRGAPDRLRLWAMIETPRAVANCMEIAETGRRATARLDCLVTGTNDLIKETGVAPVPGRPHLSIWLMQIILAARAAGLDVLDGVYNNLRDSAGFETECHEGKSMGFDGKTLIHPSQIDMANTVFGASEEALAAARSIVAAFARPENEDRGVIQIEGQMVERLHLEQARSLLAKAAMLDNRKGDRG